MLTARRQHFQMLLSVAGSIGVITAALAGADVGVLVYGLRGPLIAAILVDAGTGLTLIFSASASGAPAGQVLRPAAPPRPSPGNQPRRRAAATPGIMPHPSGTTGSRPDSSNCWARLEELVEAGVLPADRRPGASFGALSMVHGGCRRRGDSMASRILAYRRDELQPEPSPRPTPHE